MNKLTAISGWEWLKDGFVLFRQRPGQLTMLFSSYLFVMIVLGMIPLIGQLLPLFMAPTFSMVFMTACVQIKRGRGLNPIQLRASFAPPVTSRLMLLGAIYILGALIAVGLSYLIDGGLFLKLMMGQRDVQPTGAQSTSALFTLLLLAAAFIPAFWYAPPLIVWQKMPVGKAVFYSFFSVIRAYKTFLVYFLAWITIGALLPSLLIGVLAMIVGKAISMLIMFVVTIVLTVVMYCSFYPTYVGIFGEPELPELPDFPEPSAPDLP